MSSSKNIPLVLLVFLGTSAIAVKTQAAEPVNSGYARDSSGRVVTSSMGDCWHTSSWTPALATVVGCDGVIARAAPVVPPVRAQPAPPPSPPLQVPPIPAPQPTSEKVTFATDTFFDFDKAILKPEGKRKLDELASRLDRTSVEVVVAVGHTDSVGTTAYNQKLSQRRAQAVKEYLQTQRLPADRIYTQGKGETQPEASNQTREGRAKNRRVEIEVVGVRKR